MKLADGDLGAEFGARSGRIQSDEAFHRSMEALKSFLAARPAASQPDFEFEPEAPARRVAGSFRDRAGTMLLFVAIAAAVAAGLYAYGRIARSPARITPPPVAAVAPMPATIVQPPTVAAELPAPAAAPPPVTAAAFPAPPLPAIAKPLGAGDIAELQARLRTLGFQVGPVDGVAGPMTASAIKRYQDSKGQPQTGEPSDDVLAALRQDAGR